MQFVFGRRGSVSAMRSGSAPARAARRRKASYVRFVRRIVGSSLFSRTAMALTSRGVKVWKSRRAHNTTFCVSFTPRLRPALLANALTS